MKVNQNNYVLGCNNFVVEYTHYHYKTMYVKLYLMLAASWIDNIILSPYV